MKTLPTLIAALLAAAALAVPASAAEPYVPGVTDFPSSPYSARYMPFMTDFPRAPVTAPADVEAHSSSGLGSADAGLAALALALSALVAASLPALRRRRTVSSA